jgi:hypothetical protein
MRVMIISSQPAVSTRHHNALEVRACLESLPSTEVLNEI